MTTENIVQMPTLLDRLWGKLKACMAQEHTNRAEWIAIQETKCATLVEIRDQFKADIEFGQACQDNGFGEDVINRDDRAAAIAMGREPLALKACLMATTRRSLQMIYRSEFNGFRSATKPTTRRTAPPKPNKLQPARRMNTMPQAEAAAKALLDEGKTYAEAEVTTGLSGTVLRSAVAREEGRREALANPVVTPADLSMSAQQKLETAIRQHQKKLDLDFEEKVRLMVLSRVAARQKRLDEMEAHYKIVVKGYRGCMKEETYKLILRCLHPDSRSSASDRMLQDAFAAWNKLKLVLVATPETPIGYGGMPKTLAGWLKRKEDVKKARAAARAKKTGSTRLC